jgi:xanthine dehydrogenase accessory factor
MDGKIVENEGMICGGNVDVFVEPVCERYREIYAGIRSTEKGGVNGVVVTRYSNEFFKKTLVKKDGAMIGDSLDGMVAEQIQTCMDGRRPFIGDGVLIEPVVPSSILYLFGAGHVSQYVARVAAMVGFTIVVIDDRADFANIERFPEASGILAEDFQTVFSHLEFHGNEYVAILTRGHKHDALVLEELLKKPTRYIGMIGSRRKTKLIFNHLRDKGFEESALKSVYAPIGVSIDAETPEEIAVSIVAQLIEVRRRA